MLCLRAPHVARLCKRTKLDEVFQNSGEAAQPADAPA
jgi:hypothetical protein